MKNSFLYILPLAVLGLLGAFFVSLRAGDDDLTLGRKDIVEIEESFKDGLLSEITEDLLPFELVIMSLTVLPAAVDDDNSDFRLETGDVPLEMALGLIPMLFKSGTEREYLKEIPEERFERAAQRLKSSLASHPNSYGYKFLNEYLGDLEELNGSILGDKLKNYNGWSWMPDESLAFFAWSEVASSSWEAVALEEYGGEEPTADDQEMFLKQFSTWMGKWADKAELITNKLSERGVDSGLDKEVFSEFRAEFLSTYSEEVDGGEGEDANSDAAIGTLNSNEDSTRNRASIEDGASSTMSEDTNAGTARSVIGVVLKSIEHLIVVQSVVDGSPAAEADVRNGDILVPKIEGQEFNTMEEVIGYIGSISPGESLDLQFVRHGQRLTKSITIVDASNLYKSDEPTYKILKHPTQVATILSSWPISREEKKEIMRLFKDEGIYGDIDWPSEFSLSDWKSRSMLRTHIFRYIDSFSIIHYQVLEGLIDSTASNSIIKNNGSRFLERCRENVLRSALFRERLTRAIIDFQTSKHQDTTEELYILLKIANYYDGEFLDEETPALLDSIEQFLVDSDPSHEKGTFRGELENKTAAYPENRIERAQIRETPIYGNFPVEPLFKDAAYRLLKGDIVPNGKLLNANPTEYYDRKQVAEIALERFTLWLENDWPKHPLHETASLNRLIFEGKVVPLFEDLELAYEGLGRPSGELILQRWPDWFNPPKTAAEIDQLPDFRLNSLIAAYRNEKLNVLLGAGPGGLRKLETIINGKNRLVSPEDLNLRIVMRFSREDDFREDYGVPLDYDMSYVDLVTAISRFPQPQSRKYKKQLDRDMETFGIDRQSIVSFFRLGQHDLTPDNGVNFYADYQLLRKEFLDQRNN